MRRARAGRVHLRSINYITSQTTTSLPNKQHHQILSTTPTKPHKMANGYVALAAAPVARKAEELTTPARMAIAGASSSASSSSSSFPPSHGSLVPRARLGRMFVVGFYTFFPLSAWSWLWSCSLSPPLLLLGSRSRSGLEQDRTKWDRLGSYFSREETHTLTRIIVQQCLALNPHPLRLELLAHVGYVFTIISSFLPPSMRHFMLYQPTITIKKRQAQPS